MLIDDLNHIIDNKDNNVRIEGRGGGGFGREEGGDYDNLKKINQKSDWKGVVQEKDWNIEQKKEEEEKEKGKED